MARAKEDLSWGEVATLGRRYLRIPFALFLVEAFYWFLTQPTYTLAPLQVTEAWIWHHLTEIIFGAGTSTLTQHQGWTTMVELHHPDFYRYANGNTLSLYVSDECAGVHEMIFIGTLIMMTDGIPQRFRWKSVGVMCAIVFILNIIRLLVLYPIAVSGCASNPNILGCESEMWKFHTFVYQWGFLIVLLIMWLVWFKIADGSKTIREAAKKEREMWTLRYRTKWSLIHWSILGLSLVLIVYAIYAVTASSEAMLAREIVEFCTFQDIVSSQCNNAQNDWNNAIAGSWSMTAIGLVGIAAVSLVVQHPESEEE